MSAPRGLHALARLHGVQTGYHDHAGRRVGASAEGLMAALRALRVPVERAADVPVALERRRRELWERAVEPVVVRWIPDDTATVTLRLPARLRDAPVRVAVALAEGGERTRAPAAGSLPVTDRAAPGGREYVALEAPLPRVPAGYHELAVEVGRGPGARRWTTRLIAAPRRAAGWEALPGGPAWGVIAPLYALHAEDAPTRPPDFGLLERLADEVAALGGDVVGTLPLLAAFLDDPYEPSPYAPASHLFWNELYADAADGASGAAPTLETAHPGDAFDPRGAMAASRRRLEAAADAFYAARTEAAPEMAPFVARNPRAPDYARFRALTEALGPWPRWPARLRAGDVRPADCDAEAARYHLYAQWQAERQLLDVEERAAARGVSLYLDLPLGVHPDGYDVWRERDQFALGATAGAPPDPLAPAGQDWGFHPPHPEASRRDGHRLFITALRRHLRVARVLRIDHVMRFHRLFWVPDGDAADGVYVRYPHEELYAILSLESHRAGSVIVGEDLGTVPRRVRRAMREHGVPGTYVVQFELDDVEHVEHVEHVGTRRTAEGAAALRPRRVGEGALAAIGTHDTATFAGWWTGRDVAVRAERGLLDAAAAAAEVEGRAALRSKLVRGLAREIDFDFELEPDFETGAGTGLAVEDAALGLAVQEALYRVLGRSKAGLVLASLEDLWMETEPQNVPGTPAASNWRRRSRRPIGALADAGPARLLTALNDAREDAREDAG